MAEFSPEDKELLTSLIERAFFWARANEATKSKQNVSLIESYFGEATANKVKRSLKQDKSYVPPILRSA